MWRLAFFPPVPTLPCRDDHRRREPSSPSVPFPVTASRVEVGQGGAHRPTFQVGHNSVPLPSPTAGILAVGPTGDPSASTTQRQRVTAETESQMREGYAPVTVAQKRKSNAKGIISGMLLLLPFLLPVAFARIFFPSEAKIVVRIAQADSPKELDLSIELGRKYFPHCSEVIDKFLNEESTDLFFLESGTPEDQHNKRMRFSEVREDVNEAFSKDKAAVQAIGSSATSSSSSPRGD